MIQEKSTKAFGTYYFENPALPIAVSEVRAAAEAQHAHDLTAREHSHDFSELVLITATCTGIPQAVPMMLGMFHKKAPDWAAWSTLAVGFTFSLLLVAVLTKENPATWFAACNLNSNELNK